MQLNMLHPVVQKEKRQAHRWLEDITSERIAMYLDLLLRLEFGTAIHIDRPACIRLGPVCLTAIKHLHQRHMHQIFARLLKGCPTAGC